MQDKEISTRRSNLSPAKRALLEKRLQVESLGLNKAPLIPRRNEHEPVPLSFAQHRLWFLDQLEPGNAFYNITGAIRLTGNLNQKALEESLSEIQRRHEVLRTTFRQTNEQPIQVIHPAKPLSLPIADLSDLEKNERQTETQQLTNSEAVKPFDLGNGPLLRCCLLRLDHDEHVVLLTMHHIVSDGWSMGVLIKEVTALYGAYSKGAPSPLRELAIQYGDYAAWWRRSMEGMVLEAELSYWKQQLSGAPSMLELPTDRPRPAVQTSRGEYEVMALSAELTERLKALSGSEDVTLFMLLLAAFNAVLYRYTGQEDILIGTSMANRTRTLIEEMIGFFINTLVLRTNLSGDPSFRDLLKQVRRVVVDASAHQDLPFEMLVESLQPERSLSHTPVFQVIFEMQNSGQETLTLEGLKLSNLVPEKKASQFDISLWLMERDGELIGTMNYSADLFDAPTIRRLLKHYETLLTSIVDDLDQRVLALPLLTEAERWQLVQEWNDTDKDYDLSRCMHELFQEQAERTPDAIAAVCNHEQLSYRRLNSRANRLAWALAERGAGPDFVLGLLADRSLDFLVAILAAFKAGAAYLPLDPAHPAERHSVILSQSRVPMVLTTKRFLPGVSQTVNLLPSEMRPLICDLDDLSAQGKSEENLPSRSNPDNLAYVIYTSGSTGLPKGVMIEHRGMLNHLQIKVDDLRLTSDDVVAQTASQCFDISVWQFLAALLAGGRVHIFEDEIAYDSIKLLKQVERAGISILEMVPSLLRAMLEGIENDGLARLELRALRWLIPTGEALPPDLCRRWLARHPDIPLLNAYGPTECSDDVTHYPIVRAPLDGVALIPIGRALANMRLYILDGLLQPVPVGVAAEVYVGGVGVGRGYLRDAKRTSESFLPGPFGERDGARLYKTGDLGRYLAGGEIEFLGRRDHQVKVRGFRIELGEIEAMLAEHPQVRENAVIAREEPRGGDSLVAYVVTEEQASGLAGELRRYLRERLPEYMIPTAYVELEKLPRTANGKLDRRGLASAEVIKREESAGVTSTMMTPVEEMVGGIWSEVLGLEAVSAEDNFFELGGHSLLATRVISRVRSALGVEVGVREIFEKPTLKDFANRVQLLNSKGGFSETAPLRRVERTGPLALSFAQQRLWFLDQLEPGSAFYNIPSAVRLTGELNLPALEQTLGEILRRHEVLRTRFEEVEGELVQVVGVVEAVKLKVVDLRGVDEEERERQGRQIAREEEGRGFDLSRGPMMRVVVVRVSEEEHMVVFTMHHIVSDEWSTDLLVKEVRQLYEAFSGGERSGLDELAVQYADYAAWQRERLKGEELEEEMSYWREQLSGAPEVIELVTDNPRPARQSYRGATEGMLVSEEVSEGVRRLSRAEDATLFMVMLGVLKVMLYRYSGQTDLVVGSPVANRGRQEVEGLIGFFVNTLVLRTRLKETDSFREVIRGVRETSLQAYMHQELPFEMLVEELEPERSLSHSPLFQVMFVLQQGRENELEMKGAKLGSVGAEVSTAKFDLTLFVTDSGERLITAIEYNTDLYKRETIRGMLGHFGKLMEEVSKESGRPIRELEMMSSTEREQVLVEWNRTEEVYGGAESLHEMFEEQVERTPDAVAVVKEEEEVSYEELNRRANRLAHYLREEGVRPEERVGLCVSRGIGMAVGMLGILKAGAGYVPMDVTYPAERLRYMVEDSGAEFVVSEKEVEGKLGEVGARVICIEDVDEKREENPRSGVTADNVLYVIYTSGSTGKPKGISMPHRALVNLLKWYRRELTKGRILQFASIGFDASIYEMFGGWVSGGTVVIVGEEKRADVAGLGEYIVEQQVEKVVLPVVVLQQMAEEYSGREEELGALKEVITTGEQLQVSRAVKQMFERMGWSELHNHYGPAESHVVTAYQMEGAVEEWEWEPPIGKPISNTQMYIMDEEKEAVPVRVAGELYVSGAGLARGYLNQAGQTAEKFLPDGNSREPGARTYRTGDLARYLEGGEIEYLGRRDNQVKIRGFRIELGEVEAVLSEHEMVKESAVVVREAEGRGKQLVAYVVSEGERRGIGGELRKHMRERVPDYMIPTAYVELEKLPLTVNGKVDRRGLGAAAAALEMGKREEKAAGSGMLTPVEEVVGGIWSEVLRMEGKVSREDNFFELGGHSLLATRVISRVRSAFNVEVPLRVLFEAPTLNAFAECIEVARSTADRLEAPPLVPEAREGQPPLSFAQERLWFLSQLEPGNPFYNIPAAVRFEGALDVPALERSVKEIVRRHEILRTTFALIEGRPVQVIAPEANVDLAVSSLSELPVFEREIEAKRLAAEEAEQPFDLTRGPLLRVRLVRMSERQMLLLFTMHHIVSDGWSMEVLTNEFNALYEAYSNQKESPLPELAIQYADYAVWQRAWLQGEALERNLSYWSRQLDSTNLLELPTDRPRPAVRTYEGATHTFSIKSPVLDDLRQLSRQQSVTLFMTLIASFRVLLFRYTSQEDICVGIPIANRNRKEIEGLIGFFVNTLVLRSKPAAGMTFVELLKRERETALSAYDHQDMPFEKIVEALQPERNPSHDPLFQVMFTLLKTEVELTEPRGQSEEADDYQGTSKYDLTLSIDEASNGLRAFFEYKTALFDAATIERMANHFRTLLDGILAGPERRIDTLPLLSQVERQQLFVEWNNTFTDYPRASCIHHLFQSHASIRPDSTALTFNDQSLSYHHLNARANQLAHYLVARRVGPESVVAICVERSLEMIVGLLGILKSGAAYLPLDPEYPSQRLRYMIRDAGVTTVLTQQRVASALDDAGAEVVRLDTDWAVISRHSEQEPPSPATADNLAYVMYTSGSTGKPKGTCIPHRAVVRLTQQQNYCEISDTDVFLQLAPLAFDASTFEIWGGLLNGARLVIYPTQELSFEELGGVIKQEGVSVMWLTAGLFNMMVEEGAERLKGLKQLLAGGDVLSARHVKKALGEMRRGKVINGYGPTENTTFTCCHGMSKEEEVRESVAIGRPISNTRVYVLGSGLEAVAVGVEGELFTGGDGLARGYLNEAEQTAERFIPDAISGESGARIYRTGDLVRYRRGGEIEFIGRKDQQVKIRGYRIELAEIEAAINEQAQVKECVVVVRQAEATGKQLVAYVVAEMEEKTIAAELRNRLSERLPDYMIPSAFVALDWLPLTPNGKIDRKALPAPEASRTDQRDIDSTSKLTPVEEVVAGIWSEVLGVEAVLAEDNFFELGGHSLLATRVISRVRAALDVEVGVREIFERPTLRDFASRVQQINSKEAFTETAPLGRAARKGPLALSFAQQRLWFLDQLEPGSAFYNIPSAVRLTGELNLAALEQTLGEIIRRHEVLRTRFEEVEGEPVQVVGEAETLWVKVVDLSGVGEEERKRQGKQIAREEEGRGFDLSRGPMMRVMVVRVSEEEHMVVFTMHHIVSDEWSANLLVKEVRQLYEAFSGGERSGLDELAVQYADYAVWQRERLKGAELEEEMSYWREQLSGAPEVIELVTDNPRPARQSYRGATERMLVSEEVSEGVRRLSRTEDATLFMVLLGVLKVMLYRYSGQTDLVVGSPVANRGRQEVEGLIGFFVNTLVLRTRLRGSESFREVIRGVRETSLQAYMHQELPFEMLVEELEPERSLSHSPLFQVMFVLQQGRENELEMKGAKLASVGAEVSTAKFDLTVFVSDSGERLITGIEYNTDLYKSETIRGMLRHYGKLMEEVSKESGRPIRELEMMSSTEREQVLVEWNRTEEVYGGAESLHEMFEEQAERTPDAVAVVKEEEEVSYEELNRRANRLAHYLRGAGVGPEMRVGLCVRRGVEMAVGLLGILKAGAGYVPMDVKYPAQRLRYMVEDSGAEFVVSEKEVEGRLGEVRAKVICIDEVREERDENPISGVTAENVLYVIYTSGSTGKPKGISMPHRALVNLLEWHKRGLKTKARILQFASISFDASIHEMFGGWVSGGTVVIVGEEKRADVAGLGEYIVEQQVEKVVLPVVVLQQMAEEYSGREEELGALKEVITTGEQLQVSRAVKQMFERMRWSELHNHYGPSESHVVTAYQMKGAVEEWEWEPPIGKPISNTQMYIMDEEKEAVPVRVAGELYVSGAGLAQGYLNRAEQTAEKFLPDGNSREPGARTYRTGDLARYLEGGEIEYLGRRDNQVKIRGFRIELGEVEAVLSEHEMVKESAVVVREAEGRGKQLVAYVVSEGERRGIGGELRRYMRERLPEYMIPTAYIELEKLPLTGNGKVDRKGLAAAAAEVEKREESASSGILTPVEEVVGGIWSEVLRMEGKVSGEDNFFELGGHSLLATRVISRVRSALKVEVGVREIFERPTLRDFASGVQLLMSAGAGCEAAAVSRSERTGPLPLSFAQQRLWFLDQMEPGSAFYNIGAGVRLTGELNLAALEQTLSEIIRRHEVLRTRFEEVEGEPVQVVGEAEPLRLMLMDLSQLAQQQREQQGKVLAGEEGSTGFDLSRGPMLRAVVLRLSDQEHTVLFTMHHIVSDGWSMDVLVKEVRQLYEAFSRGERSPLVELAVQYGDYAVWQRERLRGERLDEQMSYWRDQLKGAPEVIELMTDKPRPARRSYRGAFESVELSEEMSEGIRRLSRTEDVTLFMVLLGILKVLLYRYSGQTDVVVGSPVANRGRQEVEGLLGFFVNTLVLRTRLTGADSFRDVIRAVRETSLQAYVHQELPFEMLVEELQPERKLSHSPLFQVIFTFSSTPTETLGISGLKLTPVSMEGGTSKFDITAAVAEVGKKLAVTFEYDSDLFYAETIRGMLRHYERLVECALSDPNQPISSVRLLTPKETGGISAADFPNSGLSQKDFENLMMEITKAPAHTGD